MPCQACHSYLSLTKDDVGVGSRALVYIRTADHEQDVLRFANGDTAYTLDRLQTCNGNARDFKTTNCLHIPQVFRHDAQVLPGFRAASIFKCASFFITQFRYNNKM